jgi:hypothetical protein
VAESIETSLPESLPRVCDFHSNLLVLDSLRLVIFVVFGCDLMGICCQFAWVAICCRFDISGICLDWTISLVRIVRRGIWRLRHAETVCCFSFCVLWCLGDKHVVSLCCIGIAGNLISCGASTSFFDWSHWCERIWSHYIAIDSNSVNIWVCSLVV